MPYLTIIQRLLRIRPQLSMLLSLGIECSWISCDTRGLDAGFPWLNHSAIKSRFHSFRFIGGWHSTTLGRCFLDVSCSALKDSVNREKRAGIAIHQDSFPFSHLTRGFGRYALDQCSDDECDALEVDDPKLLSDLVNAGDALAHIQQQRLLLIESTPLLQAAIEETALRQALSNLLDSALLRVPGGGWVKLEATEALGGSILVVIDDNGPDDTSLMTQTLSLAPFGSELSLEDRAQDNIVWNFVAGITIAREILEHDGSVLRMLSPYLPNALLGAGGTQIEIWLPVVPAEGAK